VLALLRQAPHPLDPTDALRLRRQLLQTVDTYFPPPGLDTLQAAGGIEELAHSFPGPALDMILLENGPQGAVLAVIEKDSVAILRLGRRGWSRGSRALTGLRRRTVHPIWPAARLGMADLDGDGRVEVFARHSDFEGLFLWRWRPTSGRLEPAQRITIRTNSQALDRWDPGDFVSGRPFFHLRRGPVRFAYDRIALGDKEVVLDTMGGLWLLDSSATAVGHLPGGFGTRLVPISDSQFVVIPPAFDALLLFAVKSDTIRPLASTLFLGRSGRAVAATQAEDALWLAVQMGSGRYRMQLLSLVNFKQPFPDRVGYLPRFGGRLDICLPGTVDLTEPLTLWDPGLQGLLENFYPTLLQQWRVVSRLTGSARDEGIVELVLRPGYRFSDGTPLTAPALKSGWEWLARSAAGARDLWWWKQVTGIEVVDSLTLRLHGLSRQAAKTLLGRPSLAAIKIDPGGGWPIGIGAFQPVEGSAGELVAVANPYYPGGRAILDSIVVTALRGASLLDILNERKRTAVKVEDRKVLEMLRRAGGRYLDTIDRRQYVALVGSRLSALGQPDVRAAVLGAIEPDVLSELLITSSAKPLSNLLGIELPELPVAQQVPKEVRPVPVEYRAGDRTAREIAERVAARLATLGVAVTLIGPRSLSSGESAADPQPIGIMVDYVYPDSRSKAGLLYELLGRYGTEFDPELERLERVFNGGADADSVARQVVLDLVKDARMRGVVEVQPFLAIPDDLEVGGGYLPSGWPYLAPTYWRLSTVRSR
jgi:hypothetical protein